MKKVFTLILDLFKWVNHKPKQHQENEITKAIKRISEIHGEKIRVELISKKIDILELEKKNLDKLDSGYTNENQIKNLEILLKDLNEVLSDIEQKIKNFESRKNLQNVKIPNDIKNLYHLISNGHFESFFEKISEFDKQKNFEGDIVFFMSKYQRIQIYSSKKLVTQLEHISAKIDLKLGLIDMVNQLIRKRIMVS